MKTIAILGLGEMGKRIASNYLVDGYNVNVYNRSYEKTKLLSDLGAKAYKTPKECVSDADVVISILRDDKASSDVWFGEEYGAIHGMKKDAIAIESSTISNEHSIKLHEKFSSLGVEFLDVPIIGSRPQAEAKALIFLVGGIEKVFYKVKEILEVNSSKIIYTGKGSSASSMKLLVNGYFGIQVSAMGELFALGEKLGLDVKSSANIFSQLPITSPGLVAVANAIASENFAPLFPIDLVVKDFEYLNELKGKIDTKSNIDTSLQNYKEAKELGYGGDNIAGVYQIFK